MCVLLLHILCCVLAGEEWQRREEQRQQLLRQKMEHYSSLERQLQDALTQVQAQQRQLSERETKVCPSIIIIMYM